jgi:hypothetical protein
MTGTQITLDNGDIMLNKGAFVPLLISRLARVCINGTVSAGHNIKQMFECQVAEYELTKREQTELSQLLSDNGYSVG